ncbi:phage tail sheath subtilisin-like domain-containing protein [Pendulispora rubella]|uniref:Phage tail sheath subtilisin-like domain-containing protein n=1 Tax=Pendulispora rubella TaxID=2741070 RepID=A0ABZ2LMQ5_9BACT
MAVSVSYPGVYVQEISSGVRTITGVATSIAAFAGWAPTGPNVATLVTSWNDFVEQFGGLDSRSYLGYAVSHFFSNGGQLAYIVRLVSTVAADAGQVGDLQLEVGETNGEKRFIELRTRREGTWSSEYGAALTVTDDRFQIVVSQKGAKKDELVPVESFVGLSTKQDDERYVLNVLNAQSKLLQMDEPDPKKDPLPVPTKPVAFTPFAHGRDAKVLDPDPNGADKGKAFVDALNANRTQGGGGLVLLDDVDLFNLLSVPGLQDTAAIQLLSAYCHQRRALLLVDAKKAATITTVPTDAGDLHTSDSSYAALYFPWITAPDPAADNRLRAFPPSGFVAGIYARTDAGRGVWKAPAGTEATLVGASRVTTTMTDVENGLLNPKGVNCIRDFSGYGTVVWGARTLDGNDEIGSEWKYVPVRRTALFIEETLYRALKWVVFEPNDEPLWAQIRLNVGAFMNDLFRQGAFQGTTPKDAYFVKCDKETTTQSDINKGIVNVVVGFAPLKPAEFVIVRIQQIAGPIATA